MNTIPHLRGLCPADQKVVRSLLKLLTRYAADAARGEDIEALVEKFPGLPSLRRHLKPEDRPYVRLVLIPDGMGASIVRTAPAAVASTVEPLAEGAYVVWTEREGKESFFLAYEDHDKYGAWDHVLENLKPDTLFFIPEEKAGEMGIPHTDVTLGELLAIRYAEQFMAPGARDGAWILPPPDVASAT